MATKNPANGIYYIDTEVRGIRIRKSLRTKNKVEADKRERKILDALIFEALQREAGIEPEVQTGIAPRVKEFYEDTLLPWAEDEYKKRQRTLRGIKERMALVLTYDRLAKVRLDAIDETDLDYFKAWLTGRNYEGRTINNALGCLRCVLRQARRWSKKNGYRVYVPDFSKAKAKERKHDRVVSVEEERAYAAACPTRKHYVFFKLLINSGMEPGYAAPARWEHVHFDEDEDRPNGWVYDPCPKTETRPRDIPMTAELRQVLLEWWMEQGRPSKGWVFPSDKKPGEHQPLWSFHTTHKRMFGKSIRKNRGKGSRVFKHRQKEYGVKFIDGKRKGEDVEYFRLYDLRHTILTRLGEAGASEIELMYFAGWSSTRMAATYCHPSKGRIARMVERYDRCVAAD